jgi:hypothetical protein
MGQEVRLGGSWAAPRSTFGEFEEGGRFAGKPQRAVVLRRVRVRYFGPTGYSVWVSGPAYCRLLPPREIAKLLLGKG